jgi:hypothetical protein
LNAKRNRRRLQILGRNAQALALDSGRDTIDVAVLAAIAVTMAPVADPLTSAGLDPGTCAEEFLREPVDRAGASSEVAVPLSAAATRVLDAYAASTAGAEDALLAALREIQWVPEGAPARRCWAALRQGLFR